MKPTSINFPGEYKTALKIEAAKRGMTMEALILAAYEAYLVPSAPRLQVVPVPESEPDKLTGTKEKTGIVNESEIQYYFALTSPVWQAQHELLQGILTSGDTGSIIAISWNLVVFTRNLAASLVTNERGGDGDTKPGQPGFDEALQEAIRAARRINDSAKRTGESIEGDRGDDVEGDRRTGGNGGTD